MDDRAGPAERPWSEASPLRGRMIFLVGAQRSGTNWLQRIVAAHPDVASVPSETNLFSLGIEPLMERFHHGAIGSYRLASTYIDRAELLTALRSFCDTVFESVRGAHAPDATRLLERTPDHVRHLRLMSEVYPDARFLHIIRDGRDVVRSLVSQTWGPDSIAEAAERWRSAVECAREAAPHIQHYLEIRYEELLADPRAVTEGLYHRLGLQATDTVLDQALAEARFTYNVDPNDPRVGQGKWQATFSEGDLEVFHRTAGGLLEELGYEAGRPSTPARTQAEGSSGSRRAVEPRTLLKRVVTAIRRRRGAAPIPAGQRLERSRQAQEVLDRFLELVATARFGELQTVLQPLPRITVFDRGRRWEGTGPTAIERLQSVLDHDEALRGRQVLGDTWPGVPATVLLSYVTEDGARHDRVFVLYVHGRSIARLAYYRLPLYEDTAARDA